MRRRNSTLSTALTAFGSALLAVLLVTGGPALASGDDAEIAITACVKNTNGKIRISQNGKCKNGEHLLVWSNNAAADPPALTVNLRERTETLAIPPTNGGAPVGVSASCEPGEVAVGGGLTNFDAGLKNLKYIAAGPFSDGANSGWYVEWINEGPSTVNTSPTVGALCVTGTINNVALGSG